MLWDREICFEAAKDGAGGSGGAGSGNQQGGSNNAANSGGGSAGDGKNPEGGDPPLAFDDWIKGQPENVRTMLDGHTRGLKTALDKERDDRKKLEKDLRDLAGKAEKDSDAQKRLTEMADQLGEADRRADFYEAAHAAGISNLKLAYTVAVQDEMFDRKGNVNFEEIKRSYPELFGGATKKPAGNAGEGTNNNQPAGKGMNDFIRRAAGRS